MLGERNGFYRLFCCGMLIFDELFNTNGCTSIDFQNVYASTCIQFQDMMNRMEKVSDIEDIVFNMVTRYFSDGKK